MSGHCAVLLISTVFDHYGSPGMFYILWIVLGAMSGLKVVCSYHLTGKAPPICWVGKSVFSISYPWLITHL